MNAPAEQSDAVRTIIGAQPAYDLQAGLRSDGVDG